MLYIQHDYNDYVGKIVYIQYSNGVFMCRLAFQLNHTHITRFVVFMLYIYIYTDVCIRNMLLDHFPRYSTIYLPNSHPSSDVADFRFNTRLLGSILTTNSQQTAAAQFSHTMQKISHRIALSLTARRRPHQSLLQLRMFFPSSSPPRAPLNVFTLRTADCKANIIRKRCQKQKRFTRPASVGVAITSSKCMGNKKPFVHVCI